MIGGGTIRAVVSHALSQKGCRRGWTGQAAARCWQVLLPIPWECDQVDQIRDAVVQVYEQFQQGIEPDACVARMPRADGSKGPEAELGAAGLSLQIGHAGRPRSRGMAAVVAPGDWEVLIAAFREHKLISGEIKPSTWHRVYRHHMNHVLGAVAVAAPPQNAKQLLEPRLGEYWEPPQDRGEAVGRSLAAKAITTLLEVEPILALARVIMDARWRLEERFPTQELPPMQPGLGGGYVGHYLMNRPLWK